MGGEEENKHAHDNRAIMFPVPSSAETQQRHILFNIEHILGVSASRIQKARALVVPVVVVFCTKVVGREEEDKGEVRSV